LAHSKKTITDKKLVCWTDTEESRNTTADQVMNEKMHNMGGWFFGYHGPVKTNKASSLMKERNDVQRTMAMYDKIKAVHEAD
jgi:hypothetical protein